jgi:rod shape-determining protein MreC
MKHLNVLAFVVFGLLLAWVFMFSAETKRRIQRPILSMFGLVHKATHALTADEDVVNGVNLAPDALAEKYSEEELAERYSYLLREMMELRAIKSQFAQIQRDNMLLRRSLKFTKSSNLRRLVPARVIKRESSTWWNELWINKGESSGFFLDSPVLTTTLARDGAEIDPALVGKVTGLTDGTAKVLLLTDERCKVAARVKGTQESGLLMGSRTQDGTPILKLRYLSKNTDKVLAGDEVLSSNAGGVVPANFLLGRVTKFEKLEFYGEATVEPAVDFAQLTDVFVYDEKTEQEVFEDAEKADAAGVGSGDAPETEPIPRAQPAPEIPRAPRAVPVADPEPADGPEPVPEE